MATEMVWDNVEHVFCDNDPFCQAVLKKHWPQSKIYGDIRTLTAESSITRLEGRGLSPAIGRKNERTFPRSSTSGFDLLTGGFPCQPFSQAGRRRGTEDDRHLWPEMLRVIREFHPRWVTGENVGGFVTWNGGMVLEQVHADLESEGYEVQAFIIPAVSVNAPHRRDRVWIVAHRTSERLERRNGKSISDKRRNKNGPDTEKQRLQRGKQPCSFEGQKSHDQLSDGRSGNGDWNQNWLEVAARLCTVDDGLPNGLARPRGWRNAALKGASNAIVPQVAAEIFKAIKLCDSSLQ